MSCGAEAHQETRLALGQDRVLTITKVGADNGWPVLYFHGAGDCSLALPTDLTVLDTANVTVFGVDRPGYGQSTRVVGRTLDDWVADVNVVADALAINEFGVLAWSAGTVYALASAAKLARVAACAMYGAVAPPDMPAYAVGVDEMTLRCAAAARDSSEELRSVMAAMTADPVAFTLGIAAADLKGQTIEPELVELLTTVARRAFAQGSDPTVDDFELIYRDWGFAVEDVQCPVLLTVGSNDTFTPPRWTSWLASRLPRAQVQQIDAGVHADFLRREVFDSLIIWLSERRPN